MPQQAVGRFDVALPEGFAVQSGADDSPSPAPAAGPSPRMRTSRPSRQRSSASPAANFPKRKFSPQATMALNRSANTVRTTLRRGNRGNSSKGGRKICCTPMRSRDVPLDLIGLDRDPHRFGAALPRRKGEHAGGQPLLVSRLHHCRGDLGVSAVDPIKESQRHSGGIFGKMCGQSIREDRESFLSLKYACRSHQPPDSRFGAAMPRNSPASDQTVNSSPFGEITGTGRAKPPH